jgi:hypothetical protein
VRWKILSAVLAGALLGTMVSAAQRPGAFESFTLEQGDQIIAEAPGCYAECRLIGTRRSCTIREMGCKAICKTLPECRPSGTTPMKACAIVSDRR